MNRRNIDVRNRANDYIALLELDFSWKRETIEEVKELWEEGYIINYIADKLNREGDEVFLLLMDLARKGEIEKRKNGIWKRKKKDIKLKSKKKKRSYNIYHNKNKNTVPALKK